VPIEPRQAELQQQKLFALLFTEANNNINPRESLAMLINMLCLLQSRRGATAIEYGLIAAGIAVAIITILGTLGDELNTLFESIQGAISAKNTVT
jgi:pilus assembly protein Flp/PilA